MKLFNFGSKPEGSHGESDPTSQGSETTPGSNEGPEVVTVGEQPVEEITERPPRISES